MPTTLPSPVDRGEFRFVPVDAAGGVFGAGWTRRRCGCAQADVPDAEGVEREVVHSSGARPRRGLCAGAGPASVDGVGDGALGRRTRLAVGFWRDARRLCGTSGAEWRETRGDAVGTIRGLRASDAEPDVGPVEEPAISRRFNTTKNKYSQDISPGGHAQVRARRHPAVVDLDGSRFLDQVHVGGADSVPAGRGVRRQPACQVERLSR